MIPDRTELEWVYDPTDFFEVAYRYAGNEYELAIDGGRAVATLRVPQAAIHEQIQNRIGKHLRAIFLVRQLQIHRTYNVQGPRLCQHTGGQKNIAITLGDAEIVVFGERVDIIVRDAAGNVVRDTKADRIAEHTALMDSIAPKVPRSPLLHGLLESYSRSVSDPGNELVHLYEVRDAIAKHYGGKQHARAALNITDDEWNRLGVLANVEPLEQGRHRGKHVAGRRSANDTELDEARSIVRKWIIAFAREI
jgi:hypothetical protein